MGNAECMEILGCLYFQGEDGLDTDYVKAFSWLDPVSYTHLDVYKRQGTYGFTGQHVPDF